MKTDRKLTLKLVGKKTPASFFEFHLFDLKEGVPKDTLNLCKWIIGLLSLFSILVLYRKNKYTKDFIWDII